MNRSFLGVKSILMPVSIIRVEKQGKTGEGLGEIRGRTWFEIMRYLIKICHTRQTLMIDQFSIVREVRLESDP